MRLFNEFTAEDLLVFLNLSEKVIDYLTRKRTIDDVEKKEINLKLNRMQTIRKNLLDETIDRLEKIKSHNETNNE